MVYLQVCQGKYFCVLDPEQEDKNQLIFGIKDMSPM